MTFRTIQMPFTVFQYPGLSSDGNWIVFPAADANNKWDIYWMHNSGGEARRVTFDSSSAPPGRSLGASISPDGSLIAYNRYKSVVIMKYAWFLLMEGSDVKSLMEQR